MLLYRSLLSRKSKEEVNKMFTEQMEGIIVLDKGRKKGLEENIMKKSGREKKRKKTIELLNSEIAYPIQRIILDLFHLFSCVEGICQKTLGRGIFGTIVGP